MTRPPDRPTPRTARWAAATLVATLVLVALGGYTRGSGSGYGCQDRWPLCEDGALGGLLPRADSRMIVEWSHRWVAAVVGILVLVTAVLAWRDHRRDRAITGPALGAVVLVGAQAWLGRLVVQRDLDADLVSLHLANATVVAGLLAAVAVHAAAARGRLPAAAPDRRWAALLGAGAAATFAVLVLGSSVHNEFVGGWPLVGDRLVPEFVNRVVTVHFAHRLAAGLGTVLVAWLALAAARRGRPRGEVLLAQVALACYLGNVALGAAHVATEVRSSGIVVAHLALATVAWTALVTAALAAAVASPVPARGEA